MKRKLILAVAFICTLTAAFFAATNIIHALERQTYTATYSMQSGGLNRTYKVIAPVATLPKSAPIIVVLSGIAASFDQEVQRDRFVPFVSKGRAELVYPDGIGKSWNAIGCCGRAGGENVDDIGFLTALVARVDPGHQHPIYLVGYSNGGRMAYRMACSSPGLFDGTAVVKAMPMPGCVVTRPMTLLQIDALDDPDVAIAPGDPGRETPPASVEIGLVRDVDGCAQHSVASPYPAMTATMWNTCTSGNRVGFAVWNVGGHNFPPPKGMTPGASSVIWAFFTSTAIAPLPR
jgi:polyhydroxybutyrate depolymerase